MTRHYCLVLLLLRLAGGLQLTAIPNRPRILLIDCMDSYTENVAEWLGAANGNQRPCVVSHDDAGLITKLKSQGGKALKDFDAVVLSPGPGHPEKADDFRNTAAGLALRSLDPYTPLLGVCLGHQGLAAMYGYRISRLPLPLHGVVDSVFFSPEAKLFRSMPLGFKATRYHSLTASLDKKNPDSPLRVTARSAFGDILALEHATLPRFGLQFHPESVATEHGHIIARNFMNIVTASTKSKRLLPVSSPYIRPSIKAENRRRTEKSSTSSSLRLVYTELKAIPAVSVELAPAVYEAMYPSSQGKKRVPSYFFDGDGSQDKPCVMGDADGDYGFILAHDATTKETLVSRSRSSSSPQYIKGDFLPLVREELARHRPNSTRKEDIGFDLGFVGYLGYGMRAQTRDYEPSSATSPYDKNTPDAAMLFSDRALVLTADGRALVLELVKDTSTGEFARRARNAILQALQSKQETINDKDQLVFTCHLNEDSYTTLATEALERIAAGDSYEICLTTHFEARLEATTDPWLYYKKLRAANPAPRASFLDLRSVCGVALCSSSPERFFCLQSSGSVEAKPIKGTSPRIHNNIHADQALANDLALSTKNRAENLMIADLLRNDLLRVCDSARVSKLAAVESFATVHQLVTTLKAQLRPENDAIDLIVNTFPPGSMTGAPKRRTCDIISSLESKDRGAYAGTVGFLGLDGRADLAVVIRSAVFSVADDYTKVTVGAGGALTTLSEIHDEWHELLLKANAVISSLGGRIDLSTPTATSLPATSSKKVRSTTSEILTSTATTAAGPITSPTISTKKKHQHQAQQRRSSLYSR